jgi:hypothetical protein
MAKVVPAVYTRNGQGFGDETPSPDFAALNPGYKRELRDGLPVHLDNCGIRVGLSSARAAASSAGQTKLHPAVDTRSVRGSL